MFKFRCRGSEPRICGILEGSILELEKTEKDNNDNKAIKSQTWEDDNKMRAKQDRHFESTVKGRTLCYPKCFIVAGNYRILVHECHAAEWEFCKPICLDGSGRVYWRKSEVILVRGMFRILSAKPYPLYGS